MIRYDWTVLQNYPLNTILGVLYTLSNKKTIKTASRKILEPISKFGVPNSFLVNPMGLILEKNKHTTTDMFIYLELASLRSYTHYKRTGSLRLPTYYIEHDYFPRWPGLDRLRLNTCLDVTNEEIIFKYEETK